MLKTTRSFIATFLLLGAGTALIPSVALAQFANSGDDRNPFSRASTGDTSGLMQLINQAQLSGKATDPNYLNLQKDQINSATEEFRARQLQVLRERAKESNLDTSAK